MHKMYIFVTTMYRAQSAPPHQRCGGAVRVSIISRGVRASKCRVDTCFARRTHARMQYLLRRAAAGRDFLFALDTCVRGQTKTYLQQLLSKLVCAGNHWRPRRARVRQHFLRACRGPGGWFNGRVRKGIKYCTVCAQHDRRYRTRCVKIHISMNHARPREASTARAHVVHV